MFLVDVHGNRRCPKCEGFIVPMAHPDEMEGIYCRNCGKTWYYNQVDGNEVRKNHKLPTSGTDTYTSSDHLDKQRPPE